MPTDLLNALCEIKDFRRKEEKLYGVGHVVLFSILAMLAGARSYRQIHTFIGCHIGTLRELFQLRWKSVPAYTSVRNILQGLEPEEVERAIRRYTARLAEMQPAPALKVVAIDGKMLKHSFDHLNDRKAAHVLSAFTTETHLILGHLAVDDKTNEIPAAQRLIRDLGLTEHLFTLDAMHCQKNV